MDKLVVFTHYLSNVAAVENMRYIIYSQLIEAALNMKRRLNIK